MPYDELINLTKKGPERQYFPVVDCRIKTGHPFLVEVSARRRGWWQSEMTSQHPSPRGYPQNRMLYIYGKCIYR